MKNKILFVFLFVFLNVIAQSAKEYQEMAIEAFKIKKYESSIILIENAIKLDSTDSSFYLDKALYLQENKQFLDAFKTYNFAISKFPTNKYLYNGRGVLLITVGEFDLAIESFTDELKIIHKDSVKIYAGVLLNRAAAKGKKRDFEGSYADLILALENDPDNVGILCNLGAVCDEIGRGDETLNYLKRALEVDPSFVAINVNIGFKYQVMEQYKESITYFDIAIAHDSNDALAYSNRAYSWLKLGEIKKALLDINKSIALYPANSYAYRIRGLIYIETKEITKACNDLHSAADKGFKVSYGDEVNTLLAKYCKD